VSTDSRLGEADAGRLFSVGAWSQSEQPAKTGPPDSFSDAAVRSDAIGCPSGTFPFDPQLRKQRRERNLTTLYRIFGNQ
jgi:hypothetical protein